MKRLRLTWNPDRGTEQTDFSESQKKFCSEFMYSYGKELFSILDVMSFPNLEDEEKVF